ncbi:hypothetical protein BH10ACT1_BH10ACT1_17530 [soil metagenome]
MRTARLLSRPGNGVLSPTEQQAFDAALREVMKASTDRLGRSFGRGRPTGPPDVDPELRRSYQRAQRRLEAQAARARQAFPQLTDAWDTDEPVAPAEVVEPVVDPEVTPTGDAEADGGDDVSIGTFEAEVAQTSDMMDVLEQIAGIQQQQLDHQRKQLLSETRGVFFALAVSVAVIVAGVAPLVEASPHDRRVILLTTAIVCTIAGCGYAAVRAFQSRSD